MIHFIIVVLYSGMLWVSKAPASCKLAIIIEYYLREFSLAPQTTILYKLLVQLWQISALALSAKYESSSWLN